MFGKCFNQDLLPLVSTLIGQLWSRYLDTDLSLVKSDHVTWIIAYDWSRYMNIYIYINIFNDNDQYYIGGMRDLAKVLCMMQGYLNIKVNLAFKI